MQNLIRYIRYHTDSTNVHSVEESGMIRFPFISPDVDQKRSTYLGQKKTLDLRQLDCGSKFIGLWARR